MRRTLSDADGVRRDAVSTGDEISSPSPLVGEGRASTCLFSPCYQVGSRRQRRCRMGRVAAARAAREFRRGSALDRAALRSHCYRESKGSPGRG
jgi:hypothetical protein